MKTLGQVGAVLVEDLDAIVLAIADEETPARIQRDRVRLADLARARSFLAPLLDERAILRELHHAIVLAVAMTVGDEDVAIRPDEDVRGLIEEVRTGATDTRLAERHQYFALRVELEDLVPLAVLAARVGHPEVALAIDRCTMWEDEHPLPPRGEDLSVRVVLDDRRLAASRTRVLETAMDDVNGSVGCRLDRGDRRPRDTRRKLAPVPSSLIRLREIVARCL